MHYTKGSATAAFGIAAALWCRIAAGADTAGPYYLAYRPGVSVQYLSLNESGANVSGYMEAVVPSATAAGGQSRVQTYSSSSGTTLSFGAFHARRTADGYTLTTMTRDGIIIEVRFVRSSALVVNASLVALSASVGRNRLAADRVSGNAELKDDNAISALDSLELAKAQIAIDTAAALLDTAQTKAQRLTASARQARVAANAAMDMSGVSLQQNQNRMVAMKMADDAEQNVTIARHSADLAATDVGTAKAAVVQLRLRIADVAARIRSLTAHLANDGATQR